MAAIDFPYQPFFSNKNRAFWYLQIMGWTGFLVLRVVTAIANGQPVDYFVTLFVQVITGFSITLLLSVVYRTVIDRRPAITIGITIMSVLIGSALYAYTDGWVVQTVREGADDTPFAQWLLTAFYIDITLVGGWTALYYAINFFVRAEEQQDQMLRLEAAATSAQLTMLRYQLNPHFLFNTLNSISTLVLLKQTGAANAMLSRLSTFLRFTLVNEAEAKVTVAHEVETLQLYLEIEKMRFEERLRTHFEIAPEAARALIPSLLLQPLVENAIKYAVTPNEGGAEILISAQVIGDRLQLVVSDTGPGLMESADDEAISTGVGMTNTGERLSQAYGEDHRFLYHEKSSGGFEVLIEIPYHISQAGGNPDDGQIAAGAQQVRTATA